jgi:hypothetical protein
MATICEMRGRNCSGKNRHRDSDYYWICLLIIFALRLLEFNDDYDVSMMKSKRKVKTISL